MIILAHRGLNKNIKHSNNFMEINSVLLNSHATKTQTTSCQGNTLQDFKKSFEFGYGVEIDIRDSCCKLVISHDMPNIDSVLFEDFLKIYKKHGKSMRLAINIKSDGLCNPLKILLQQYEVDNYFVFDMSIPDTIHYFKNNMRVFTRQSEYEAISPIYKQSQGIWLDEFQEHWINEKIILSHINNNKKVCIVSPELHGRDFMNEWEDYKRIIKKHKLQNRIMICTDYADLARRFFL